MSADLARIMPIIRTRATHYARYMDHNIITITLRDLKHNIARLAERMLITKLENPLIQLFHRGPTLTR